MDGITKIEFVIDILEVLQSELESMSIDEIYDTIEDAILILAMEEIE